MIPPPLEEPVQAEEEVEEVEELVEVSPPEPEEEVVEVVEDVKCCGGEEVEETNAVGDYVAENADAYPLLAEKLELQAEEVVEE